MLRTLCCLVLTSTLASAQELAAITWTGDLVRIDPVTGAVLQSTSFFPMLNEVNSAARTPDGTWLVAADRGARLVELDPVTGVMGASIATSLDARGLAVNPITGVVYSIEISGELFTVDTSTGASRLVATVASGGWQSLAFTADGRLWAWSITQSQAQNGLWEIDPATGALLQHVQDPAGTIDAHQFLAPMPDGTFLTGNHALFRLDPITGVETFISSTNFDIRGADLIFDRVLGAEYCGPAATNSAGRSARMIVTGDPAAATNALILGCADLPPQSFGYFLTSDVMDFVAGPGGSQGNLCLGGGIGRLSNQIVNSGSAGWVATTLDLTQIPTPTGSVVATAGTTRHFSYWYRDANPGVTSNFADGRTITFD